MANEVRRSARAASATISYRVIGDGPPLLLLNGYCGAADDWDPRFIAELAEAFTVIAPDNRGMGESDRGEEAISIEVMARDALVVLDAERVEGCTVAGWSMGGMLAQELAAGQPRRVSSLALLATDPGGPEAIRRDPEVERALTSTDGTPAEQAHRLIGLLFPPGVAEDVEREAGHLVAEARAALDPEVAFAQAEAMDRWYAEPAADRLAAIASPALALAGARDIVIPPANTELLARDLGAETGLFEGGGHALMAQEPVEVARRIISFANPSGQP